MSKKTWLPLLLYCQAALILIAGCLGLESADSGFAPGTYEGAGQGYRGLVHVAVQISSAGIESIEIKSHSEPAFPGAAAMEELLDLVLIEGSTDIDAVSGATFSSRGFLEAVEEAVEKAMDKFLQ